MLPLNSFLIYLSITKAAPVYFAFTCFNKLFSFSVVWKDFTLACLHALLFVSNQRYVILEHFDMFTIKTLKCTLRPKQTLCWMCSGLSLDPADLMSLISGIEWWMAVYYVCFFTIVLIGPQLRCVSVAPRSVFVCFCPIQTEITAYQLCEQEVGRERTQL